MRTCVLNASNESDGTSSGQAENDVVFCVFCRIVRAYRLYYEAFATVDGVPNVRLFCSETAAEIRLNTQIPTPQVLKIS